MYSPLWTAVNNLKLVVDFILPIWLSGFNTICMYSSHGELDKVPRSTSSHTGNLSGSVPIREDTVDCYQPKAP